MHVTVRLVEGLPSLRTEAARGVLEDAIERANARGRIRVVHFSAQSNHVHLIVEADDRDAASNGLQGLLISLAKGLNGLFRRAGRVFADRYHDVILRTPAAVRNALAYVLNNHLRHDRRSRPVDPFSSSAWFDGWRQALSEQDLLRAGREVVARARSWLLRVGWRGRGRIDVAFVPGRSE
jgi:REP element-mobilizing transposase RayT